MIGYETVFITDPNLTDEENGKVVTKFKEIIAKQGGEVKFESSWGRRRLGYEINKKTFGNYFLLYFSGTGSVVTELETQYRYDENILKYILVKYEDLEEAYKKFEAFKKDPHINVNALTEEEEEQI